MSLTRPLPGVLPSAAPGHPAHRGQVALGILAGGQARRLGGVDKALARHRGESLLQRTLAAMGEGYAQRLLSYNARPTSALPERVRAVADLRPGFPGPLAGIESLLAAADAPWLLTVPVDLAAHPAGLAERLCDAIVAGEGVFARDADGDQPLVALWPVASSRLAVGAALDAGERAVHRVQSALGFRACELSPWLFGNLNTLAELQA